MTACVQYVLLKLIHKILLLKYNSVFVQSCRHILKCQM